MFAPTKPRQHTDQGQRFLLQRRQAQPRALPDASGPCLYSAPRPSRHFELGPNGRAIAQAEAVWPLRAPSSARRLLWKQWRSKSPCRSAGSALPILSDTRLHQTVWWLRYLRHMPARGTLPGRSTQTRRSKHLQSICAGAPLSGASFELVSCTGQVGVLLMHYCIHSVEMHAGPLAIHCCE